jgi:hypothetical protein
MSADHDPSTDSPATGVPLLDVLEFLALGQRAEADFERAEMVERGSLGIVEDLAMHLHAECAARGIDWYELLASATRRCLWPGQAN